MEQFSTNSADTLADDLQILMSDLCREWGFCNAIADDIVQGSESLTPEAFATAILKAEGWPEPESDLKWRPRLASLFETRYGAAVSDRDYQRPST